MIYKVTLTPRALQQIERAYEWGALRWPPAQNEMWFRGLRVALASLSEFPERCPPAAESAAFSYEVRQMQYPPYRVLFRVIDREVHIVAVRRSSRDRLTH